MITVKFRVTDQIKDAQRSGWEHRATQKLGKLHIMLALGQHLSFLQAILLALNISNHLKN